MAINISDNKIAVRHNAIISLTKKMPLKNIHFLSFVIILKIVDANTAKIKKTPYVFLLSKNEQTLSAL